MKQKLIDSMKLDGTTYKGEQCKVKHEKHDHQFMSHRTI